MRSIRRTLLLRLFAGALGLLLAGAALLYLGGSWLLTEQFDAMLRTKLATFLTLVDEEGYFIELGLNQRSMPEYFAPKPSDPAAPVPSEYFQVWLLEGPVLYRSESLGQSDLERRFGTETAPSIWDHPLPDGRAGRAIGTEFVVHNYEPGEEDPGPAHVVLVLARGRGLLDQALAALLAGTIAGIVLLLGAGYFIVRTAVKRGLLPLEDLARHVGAVDDPLHASHFPTEGIPSELTPLAGSHNQMLDRIRAAFERERRTTANIAHELRTPITELVILSEAAERWGDDPVEMSRRLRELREIGGQMSTLISTLLELARMESGQVALEIEPIDLSETVRACWGSLAATAEANALTFQGPDGDGPLVRADRAALSILLANLLSNAVEHAPAGDRIGCQVGSTNGRGFLVLSNAANGLAAQDLDKLAEPFWRVNSSADNRHHVGLGLSLVARLAALLQLELSFRVEGGEFRVELGFPAAESS